MKICIPVVARKHMIKPGAKVIKDETLKTIPAKMPKLDTENKTADDLKTTSPVKETEHNGRKRDVNCIDSKETKKQEQDDLDNGAEVQKCKGEIFYYEHLTLFFFSLKG